METLSRWSVSHQGWLYLIGLAISILASVFGGDLRQFVKEKPQRLNIWIARSRISATVRKSFRLKLYHEDNTELLVRYAKSIFRIVSITFVVAMYVFMDLNKPPQSHLSHRVEVILVALFGMVGWVEVVSTIMLSVELRNYESTKARLQKRIERLVERIRQNHPEEGHSAAAESQ
jgi:hypothetical protein